MASSQQSPLLPTLFGAFALSSFMTSTTMLINPEFGWRLFGVSSERRSIAGMCYASAIAGEAVLQSCACVYPEVFLVPTVIFMVPYKLMSTGSLLWYGMSSQSDRTRREAAWLAIQWLAPVAMIFGVAKLDTANSSKNYFDA
jgi:hypothetical protein